MNPILRSLGCATLLAALSSPLSANTPTGLETCRIPLVRNIEQAPVIDGNWETRNTFISSRRAQITGWKIGLDFNSKIRLGIGYNYLNTRFYRSKNIGTFNYETDRLGMRYFCAYFEYLYF